MSDWYIVGEPTPTDEMIWAECKGRQQWLYPRCSCEHAPPSDPDRDICMAPIRKALRAALAAAPRGEWGVMQRPTCETCRFWNMFRPSGYGQEYNKGACLKSRNQIMSAKGGCYKHQPREGERSDV